MDPVDSLRDRLDELQAHAATARVGVDPRGVHQLRVTASRLSALLALGRRRALLDDLRWLRRGVARARDLDVLAQRTELSSDLRAWIARERAREQSLVIEILDAPRFRALVAAFEHLEHPARERVRRETDRLRRRTLAAGEALERADAPLEAAHRLRRRLRRLRHALEWRGGASPRLRTAQTELGAINDEATLLDFVAASPFGAELRTWCARRAVELDALVAHLRAAWPELARELRDG